MLLETSSGFGKLGTQWRGGMKEWKSNSMSDTKHYKWAKFHLRIKHWLTTLKLHWLIFGGTNSKTSWLINVLNISSAVTGNNFTGFFFLFSQKQSKISIHLEHSLGFQCSHSFSCGLVYTSTPEMSDSLAGKWSTFFTMLSTRETIFPW